LRNDEAELDVAGVAGVGGAEGLVGLGATEELESSS
jgi:hypothetical protein